MSLPATNTACERLRGRLAAPLPGRAAPAHFEPPLSFGRHRGPAPANARAAAVVVLLYEHEGDWRLPLTLRPAHFATHAGQVSLPGGLIETGESSGEAALRELEEELGVPRDAVTLVGQLSPLYLYVSNFIIAPHVAWCNGRPAFRPSPDEVAELLEVSLGDLLDPRSRVNIERNYRGLRFTAPAQRIGDREVWGATAMILAEAAAALAGV